MSSVDLTLDASCILVSCKQRIEILLSRQYCMALLFKETPLWSIPCGSYNFIIESNVEMPAILKEANAMGVLLITVRRFSVSCHCPVYAAQRGEKCAAGKGKARGGAAGERGERRGNESEVQWNKELPYQEMDKKGGY